MYFCDKCGFVITDKVEESGPEWRPFLNEDENKSRTGVPTSLAMHGMGLAAATLYVASVENDEN